MGDGALITDFVPMVPCGCRECQKLRDFCLVEARLFDQSPRFIVAIGSDAPLHSRTSWFCPIRHCPTSRKLSHEKTYGAGFALATQSCALSPAWTEVTAHRIGL